MDEVGLRSVRWRADRQVVVGDARVCGGEGGNGTGTDAVSRSPVHGRRQRRSARCEADADADARAVSATRGRSFYGAVWERAASRRQMTTALPRIPPTDVTRGHDPGAEQTPRR
jgi:hypothetical protein